MSSEQPQVKSIRNMAALDAAASGGKWSYRAQFEDNLPAVLDENGDWFTETVDEESAKFIAASKGFAPAVLAALEWLIADAEREARPHTRASENADAYASYEAGAHMVIRKVRALLTADLPAAPQEVKP